MARTQIVSFFCAVASLCTAREAAGVVLLPGDIIVPDQTVLGLFRVDPSTGDRVVFSSSTVGTDPAFIKPKARVFESSGDIPAAVVATAVSGIMNQGEVYAQARINQ